MFWNVPGCSGMFHVPCFIEDRYCCRSSLLRNSIAVYELWFFPIIFQKNFQEKIRWICHSSRRQKIFSLSLSNSLLGWWKWINLKIKKIQETKLHAIPDFPVEIICGPHRGSFAVRDHLRSNLGIIYGLGIICGRVFLLAYCRPCKYCDVLFWEPVILHIGQKWQVTQHLKCLYLHMEVLVC